MGMLLSLGGPRHVCVSGGVSAFSYHYNNVSASISLVRFEIPGGWIPE